MDRGGYFKLWRKITEHTFYKEKRVYSKFEAWLDILFEAQFTEETKMVELKGKVLKQNYGEILRSTRGWCRRWQWSVGRGTRFLRLLKKMGQIEYSNEKITTRITVLNYEKYNPRRNTHGTRVDTHTEHTRNSDGPRHNKGKKEIKERNKATAPQISKKLKESIAILETNAVFKNVAFFVDFQKSQKKDEKIICHALSQLIKKCSNGDGKFEQWPKKRAWGYCEKIIEAETQIENARKSEKESELHKKASVPNEKITGLLNSIGKPVDENDNLSREEKIALLRQQADRMKNG
jgi:hypothetical protein